MLRKQALGLLITLLCLVGVACAEELPITSADRLTITVTGEPDLSRAYVVDQDGNVVVNLIGKVKVAGMTPAAARDEITNRLKKYLRDPQVTIEYAERAQISVNVLGQVGKPGPTKLKVGSRLVDAVTAAEGATIEGDPQRATLQSRGEKTARPVDLTRIAQDASLNVELKDGDTITIPRLPQFEIRVLGAVAKPGAMMRKDRVTLLDAILSAGGLTEDADDRKIEILHKGSATAERVSYRDVITGKTQQPLVGDGDTVTVLAYPKVTVHVLGHVKTAGDLKVKEGATLLDAITAAGGFQPDADKEAVLLSTAPAAPGDVEQVRRVNLEKLDGPEARMLVQDDVRIIVPPAVPIKFAVAGGVAQPGVFPMPADKSKVLLSDALAQSGGLVGLAKKKNVVIIRKNPGGGEPITQSIDWEKYLKTKDAALNPEILPNDVVYVDVDPERDRKPNSFMKILGIAGAIFGL